MRLILILPSLAFLLTSCVTQGAQTNFTNPVQPVSPAPVIGIDSRLESLSGGIVGQFTALSLNKNALQQALAAEYNALERIDPDQTLTWTDASNSISGQVVPLQPYRVGQQNCRAYTHTVTQSGETYSGRGTACRNQDGSWDLLT